MTRTHATHLASVASGARPCGIALTSWYGAGAVASPSVDLTSTMFGKQANSGAKRPNEVARRQWKPTT